MQQEVGTRMTKEKIHKHALLTDERISLTAVSCIALVAILVASIVVYECLIQPGRLGREGVVTRAILWEVKTHAAVVKKYKRSYNRKAYSEYIARFSTAENGTLYQCDMEKDAAGSHPFTRFLAEKQPFLIRYLPDDPYVFDYAFDHDEQLLTATIDRVLHRDLIGEPIIQLESVVLSNNGTAGFAVVHVSDEMRNISWLDHPLIRDKATRYDLAHETKLKSRVYVGLSDRTEGNGLISGSEHLHPKDGDKQDVFGILNLVKPGDQVEIEVHSRFGHKISGKYFYYTIKAMFASHLSSGDTVKLGPDDLGKLHLVAHHD